MRTFPTIQVRELIRLGLNLWSEISKFYGGQLGRFFIGGLKWHKAQLRLTVIRVVTCVGHWLDQSQFEQELMRKGIVEQQVRLVVDHLGHNEFALEIGLIPRFEK